MLDRLCRRLPGRNLNQKPTTKRNLLTTNSMNWPKEWPNPSPGAEDTVAINAVEVKSTRVGFVTYAREFKSSDFDPLNCLPRQVSAAKIAQHFL